MNYAKLKWVLDNGILVSFTTKGAMDPKLWNELVHDLSTMPIRKYLVTTVGSGELNSIQRKQVADIFSKKKIGVAVVTDDKTVHYVVTAISWFGVDIKAFSWKEIHEAIQHVGAYGVHEARIFKLVNDLKIANSTDS
jgi:hypothetical protein